MSDELEQLEPQSASEVLVAAVPVSRRDEASQELHEPHNLTWWEWVNSTDVQAVCVSILCHTVLLLALAVVPLVIVQTQDPLDFSVLPPIEESDFTIIEDIAASNEFQTEVGANSNSGVAMALSAAPILAALPELTAPALRADALTPIVDMTTRIEQAVGLTRSDVAVQGLTGVGTTGTDGAVDQITAEILRSMEERPTLVVWFFDQSGSLLKRRQEIRDRFDRIYEELGIVQASQEAGGKQNQSDEQLLTSVFAFGQQVNLLLERPTAELSEIRAAIDSINMDASGTERVFSAIYKGIEKFRRYRNGSNSLGPKRNVMFIVVSDERGDDDSGLDATIKECQKSAIPVYVVGVPAPFGRQTTYIKYVDPDPKFDQTPQWAEVDQGPESIMPERVKLGYQNNYFQEPVIDSGFGPFALSRLAYETGGIYFTVHPNRRLGSRVRRNEFDDFASKVEYFFDPEVMHKYRPDYVSSDEYLERIKKSPLRQTLIRAAQMARIDTLQSPTQRFVKTNEAALANALTVAQRAAARLEPQLGGISQVLLAGKDARDTEVSPRWLAGYDLALGTVLAHKVRAEAYNAMLAQAKRGMSFKQEKNNTWILQPANEISVGSRMEKEAEFARDLLAQVVQEHRGTPWALLASRELNVPIGWQWVESFTDLNPPPARAANANNNPPRPARDDQANMLRRPPPKRPVPKL